MIAIFKEEAQRGAAVVMVTHNSERSKQANRRMRLENGVLVEI